MGSDILDVAGGKNVATLPSLDEAKAKNSGNIEVSSTKNNRVHRASFKNRYFGARKIKK